MNKFLGLALIVLIAGAGVGVWWLESQAQDDELNFSITPISQSSDVQLTWTNPEYNLSAIDIYRSQLERQDGDFLSTTNEITPNEESQTRVETYGVGKKTWFTLIGKKENGQSIILGKKAVVPKVFHDTLYVSAQVDGQQFVRLLDGEGVVLREIPVLDGYTGLITIERADFNGDSLDEIIVAPLSNDPRVQIYTPQGNLMAELQPYGENFGFGFDIQPARLYNRSETTEFFAVSPLRGSDSESLGTHMIKVYRYNESSDSLFIVQDEFIGFHKFDGGVRLASGDVNGDGRHELIATPIGGLAEVRIFQFCQGDMPECVEYYGEHKMSRPWSVYDKVFPYGKIEQQNIRVTTSDLDGDGMEEMIITPDAGRTTLVKVYRCEIEREFRCLAKQVDAVQVYGDNFTGGVVASVGMDINTGSPLLAFAPQPGGGPHVKVYTWKGGFEFVHEFFAYTAQFTGGVLLEYMYPTLFNQPVLVTAPMHNGGPHIRIFKSDGSEIFEEFFAFSPDVRASLNLR